MQFEDNLNFGMNLFPELNLIDKKINLEIDSLDVQASDRKFDLESDENTKIIAEIFANNDCNTISGYKRKHNEIEDNFQEYSIDSQIQKEKLIDKSIEKFS